MRRIDTFHQLVAIDTEYHTDAHGVIDRVWCVCGTSNDGATFRIWTGDGASPSVILDRIVEATGYEEPIFVCHAFDKAERRALKFLGFDVVDGLRFVDTYHLARMLQASFDKKMPDAEDEWATDQEAIDAYNSRKESREWGLSYAGLCHRYCLALIDTAHKSAMRSLCITGEVEGHEDEIMAYCESDTAYLLPILNNLLNEVPGGYVRALRWALCPLAPSQYAVGSAVTADYAITKLVEQCRYIALFGEIADRGLPLAADRVEAIRHNAFKAREALKAEFNAKWGNFKLDRKGCWHEDTKITQARMAELVESRGLDDYPRTTRGYSLSSDTLKEYFKGDAECFGEQYRQLNKLVKQLSQVAKPDCNPFDDYYDGVLHYESLNPYGTITSRCAPSTKRFLFGWHKSLYGLLDPPPGKWLVELDYGSEETFCQCAICRDAAYNEIYNSKDIYLAFAHRMGLIPSADWATLSKGELKEKYARVRKVVKPMVLGMSYGMGPVKLANRAGLPLDKAKAYHEMITERVLRVSTTWKRRVLRPNGQNTKAFALPDGFVCAYTPQTANRTSAGNWPFQSAGGMILRELVAKLHEMRIDVRATIHDAVFFMVDEGDNAAIAAVAEAMRTTANRVLSAPSSWSMKVGDAEIIRHGEIWTPEHAFDEDFKKILTFEEAGDAGE